MKSIVIVSYSQIRVLPYLTWTFFNLRPWEEGGGAGMMAPHNNFGILAQKLLRHYYVIVMTS